MKNFGGKPLPLIIKSNLSIIKTTVIFLNSNTILRLAGYNKKNSLEDYKNCKNKFVY